MPKEQKGNIGMTVLLLAVLAATLFVVWKTRLPSSAPLITPNATPASSNLIYQNPQLGFKFTYPAKGFTVVADGEEEFFKRSRADFRKNFVGYVGYAPPKPLGAVLVKKTDEDINSQFDKAPLTIWVFDNSQGLTVGQWYQNFWYYPFVWGMFSWNDRAHVAPTHESTVSGQAVNYGIVSYQPGSPKFYYLPAKKKMFLIKVLDDENKSGSSILSTLVISN